MTTLDLISAWDSDADCTFVVQHLSDAPPHEIVAFVMALYDGYEHDVAEGEAKKLKHLLRARKGHWRLAGKDGAR